MKINPLLLAIVSLASAVRLFAGTLTSTTAVHTKPDDASPSITFLKAGSDPVPAPDTVATTPAGWMAIELSGPFEGYVMDKDLSKGLDMKPGVPIRLAPEATAGVLTTATKDDKTNITGQHGRWLQISLERKVTGYINLGGTPGYLPPVATDPAGGTPAPMSPAPVTPAAYGTAEPGRAAPIVTLGDSTSSLPRQFAGKFVSTRSPFRPRRPFDWALNDDADKRYVYVDVSKLLQTEQIDNYAGHNVVVFGAVRPTPDGKDIVVVVESLKLK
jgi:hypothetical protein